MKLATVMTIAAIAVMTSESTQAKSAPGREVTVYCQNSAGVSVVVQLQAQSLASGMFAKIGIKLDWQAGNPSRPKAGAIVIELVNGTPATFMPGSLAYALPYEGVHVRVFCDRVGTTPAPREVLAHVMAHEITHILQGIARHSEEGIMKAHWTAQEEYGMKAKSLGFTEDDVDLIYKGIASEKPGE
jgi:hypothetical protein